MRNRVIVGITGALAVGKTTVSDLFACKGAAKINADEINHRLLEKDEKVIRKLINLFGKGILTRGKINRRKLAQKVFHSKTKLDKLCKILHPRIIQCIREEVAKAKFSTVIVDAPLLIETGLSDHVDFVVVVKASAKVREERALARGISEKEFKNITAAQMPFRQKIKYADFVIDNSKDIGTTKKGVDRIWEKIRKSST